MHIIQKYNYKDPARHETAGSTYTTRLLLTLSFIDWLEGDLTGVQRNAARLLQLGQAHELLESTAFGHYHLGMTAFYLADTETARLHLAAAVKNGRLVDPNTFLMPIVPWRCFKN